MKSKRDPRPPLVDESDESEITIGADGRIFAFGITRPLAAVLVTIPTADERMKGLLTRIGGLKNLADRGDPSPIRENS